jgi:hypothetical protein
MKSDYWTENGMVFVHYGQKWGVAPSLRTILIGPEKEDTPFDGNEPSNSSEDSDLEESADDLPIPAGNVTDNLDNSPRCEVCNSPVPGKREDRHLCSARCRKRASRKG